LRLYDVAKNDSRALTWAEAEKMSFADGLRSPDGYEVGPGGGSGDAFSLFAYRDYASVYIKGHNTSRKINVSIANYYNFRFIGWIKEPRHG
jgi:hypothetical protein